MNGPKLIRIYTIKELKGLRKETFRPSVDENGRRKEVEADGSSGSGSGAKAVTIIAINLRANRLQIFRSVRSFYGEKREAISRRELLFFYSLP